MPAQAQRNVHLKEYEKMHFLIVGPGAMGCLFAGRLKMTGHEVTLLDYRPERAKMINSNGIRIEGIGGETTVQVPVITGKPTVSPDAVLVCVKAGKTRTAVQKLAHQLSEKSHIITLQNGLGTRDILRDIFGEHYVLGGVTAEGATLLGPGHIRHAGRGDTIIGPLSTSSELMEDIVSAFNAAGFSTRAVENIDDMIWGKLIINAGINTLTAITRLKNGRLPEVSGTFQVMKEAVREAERVASAMGIKLPYTKKKKKVIDVCKATAGNMASMLQDILNQRKTEVEYINGAIVRQGKATGIPTPVNHTITCLVEALQETYGEFIS